MSGDGYLRLTVIEFNALRLIHSWSVCDEEVQADLRVAGIALGLGGYTEWRGVCEQGCISVGWVWYETPTRRLEIAPRGIGPVGTNLMLVGANGKDLGRSVTDDFIRSRIAIMRWRHSVRAGLLDS
ncbi:DUF4902 domain-containing protein [Paraburkholderia sp. CHISQ3]|uniref:DUF4902 domain-containing protein n=1 Tax=Paraburkholderia TaxID=1822464 RepID=UPI0034629626